MKENLSFVFTHPFLAVRTYLFQIAVGGEIGHIMPPKGTSIEVFSKLPLVEAARLLMVEPGGVPFEDWPPSVREEMSESDKEKKLPIQPDGRHPEHRNV